MGDVYSPLDPDSARLLTLGAPASHAPAPGFFDTVRMSFQEAGAAPDWGLNRGRWTSEFYQQSLTELEKRGYALPVGSKNFDQFSMVANSPPKGSNVSAEQRATYDAFWSAFRDAQQRDPKFMGDYGGVTDWAGLQAKVAERRGAERSRLGGELQDAGTLPWLIGGLGHGLTDPFSYIPVGGGPATGGIARQLLTVGAKEAAANAGVAVLEEPLVRTDAATMGIERDLGDTLLDVGVQGLTGGLIGVAGKGAHVGFEAAKAKLDPNAADRQFGKALQAAIEGATWDVTRDGQFASDLLSPSKGYAKNRAAEAGTFTTRETVRAFEEAVPPGRRTPDEQAAVNVATREADVLEASPFRAEPAGQDVHVTSLSGALDALARGQLPPDRAAPVPLGPVPSGPLPRRAGATGLPSDIVEFFRGKGYSEPQARGIAAGIVAESRADHNIRNPDSDALGLGQWLGSRKQELLRRYGPNPTRQQQLEFLHWELQGGDAGGRKVLAAADEAGVLAAYINDFMRPAKGAETSADLSRGMAALGRGEEAVPGDLQEWARSLNEPATADPVAAEQSFANIRPDALGESSIAGMILDGQPVAMEFERFRPDQLEVDAELMQFKHGGDAMGVTDRYARVNRWNPGLADPLIVWEGKGGRRLVADGHQRHGIARRSLERYPDHPVEMSAFVMREADGFSAQDARLFAAFRNVAQGHGGPLDWAKLLAETNGVLPVGIDAAAAELRDARGIVKLQGAARAMAFAEQVRADFAGIVGNLMPDDEARQVALMQLLRETEPANLTQATTIVRDGIEAGFTDGTQLDLDLFGGVTAMSKLKKRAQVLDRALTELNKRKLVFSTVEKNADMIELAGSSIDKSAAGKEREANEQALALIARLASSAGPVKDALDSAVDARILGVSNADAARQFADAVARLDLDAIAAADRAGEGAAAGDAGDGIGSARYAADAAAGHGRPSEGQRNDAVEAVAAADAEADTQAGLFDDPAGPAAKEQSELAGHDADMVDHALAFRIEAEGDAQDFAAVMAEIGEEKQAAAELRACLTPGGAR